MINVQQLCLKWCNLLLLLLFGSSSFPKISHKYKHFVQAYSICHWFPPVTQFLSDRHLLYLLFPILTSFIHSLHAFKRRSSPRYYIREQQFDSNSLFRSLALHTLLRIICIRCPIGFNYDAFNGLLVSAATASIAANKYIYIDVIGCCCCCCCTVIILFEFF